jgi:hypothetical protein
MNQIRKQQEKAMGSHKVVSLALLLLFSCLNLGYKGEKQPSGRLTSD